ncbi:MAG TPA: hypothetical protein VFQ94_02610, partial [Gallionella sp.]|nr:hypothetical protein [Gallionella sp.]
MSLQQKIEQTVAVLQQAARDFAPACFANSLGAEDMVLTDLISKLPLPNPLPQAGEGAIVSPSEDRYPIEMFSLDTG